MILMILRLSHRNSRFCYRCYATGTTPFATTAPPMLLKIRKDLKVAMQVRDTNRLSVLRSLLSQSLNASKTSTPINTDLQMLALIRRLANASRVASAEFKSAGRQDLAEKEESELKIMEEYADGVEIVGDEDILLAVKGVISGMKDEGAVVRLGEVMKRVLAPEILGGRPVARGDIVKTIKQLLIES